MLVFVLTVGRCTLLVVQMGISFHLECVVRIWQWPVTSPLCLLVTCAYLLLS